MAMFCYQCEQTANGTGCTVNGVCGKKSDIANLQDKLTGELIGLAKAVNGHEPTENSTRLIHDGLFTTITNVNFNDETIEKLTEEVKKEKGKFNLTPISTPEEDLAKILK